MELIASQEDSVEVEPDSIDPNVPTDAQTAAKAAGFRVTLRNFEGPFDLLLNLINQRQLDVTEVACTPSLTISSHTPRNLAVRWASIRQQSFWSSQLRFWT